MNFAANILPASVVNALGWTLLHSLWQGALAALGFALFLYLSRRASARARYAMGLAVLALVLLASLATFWNHFSVPAAGGAPVVSAAPAPFAAAGGPAAALPLGRRISVFFGGYFSRHLPLIVTLWLLGVLFLSLRLTGGMLYAQRLKYSRSRPLPAPWLERLQALAAKAGLRRPLRLLESLRLRTPVVIGHLKPVLLLPAGLVTGLSAAEVEALLAHEVAHVMRRDYLVNVLQNLLEILFFFHPGVRWVSSCVRQEREHCCDDIAVELCGDAPGYARALASLQADGAALAMPAMAASGGSLLRRITRLLARPRLVHDFREGFLSALLLVAGLLGMLKLAGAASPPGAPDAAPEAATKPVVATTPEAAGPRSGSGFSSLAFALEADGKVKLSGKAPASLDGASGTWIVDESDGQVVWYMALASKAQGGEMPFADEIALRRGTYLWYLPAGMAASAGLSGARLLRQGRGGKEEYVLQAERDRLLRQEAAQEEFLRQDDERLLREEEARLKLEEEKLLKQEQARRESELQHLQAMQKKLEAEERALAEKEKRLNFEDQEKAQAAMESLRKQEQKLAQEMRKLKEREKLEFERQLQEQKKAEEELRMAEKRLRAEEERLRREEANLKKFLDRLAADGLIDPAGSYEVRLSASALTVNGKAMPTEAQQKYRQFFETVMGRKLDTQQPITIVHNED
jgi:beta-lactamase regulating signal transducer with metallopeptidase domain